MGAATRKDGGSGSPEARRIGGGSFSSMGPQAAPNPGLLRSPRGWPVVLALFALAAGGCRSETGAIGAEPAGAASFDPSRAPSIAALPKPASQPAVAETGWNVAEVAWQTYDAGIAKAKAEGKPVCVIIYADWCPHCRNYSHVFEDPRVVKRAKDFVMIRLNGDTDEAAKKYTTDGGYVPRTYFLAPDGTPYADIHAPRPKFIYFYDEHNPESVLAGMDAAAHKAGK
jgi:thiol-disulfide isomerase/thioredoxin